MAKLTIQNLRATMARLAHDGDRESYQDLWKAIDVLWNLGLADQKLKHAAVAEDHRLFQRGELTRLYDAPDPAL